MIALYGVCGGRRVEVGSGSRMGRALALLVVVLAACEPAPASQRASLVSTPLPTEPDTVSFEPMELGLPPAGTPAPAAHMGLANAEPQDDEGGPYAYPAWKGYDLDCADVGRTVRVTGGDPHRLDRDRDGWGCESY